MVMHQPHKHERHGHRLRHHQQAGHRVDAPQHKRSAIRTGQFTLGRRVAGFPRRIDDSEAAGHCRQRAHQREKHQSRTRAAFSQLRYDQRAQGDSQWLRGLADSHCQAALPRREPRGHQPAAGGVATGRGHPAEEQIDTRAHQRMRRGRGVGRSGGERRAHRQHGPLADAVQHVAPQNQRDRHAPTWHRRQQAGFGQRNATASLQRRDQERNAADEKERACRYPQRDENDRPARTCAELEHGARFLRHAPMVAPQ